MRNLRFRSVPRTELKGGVFRQPRMGVKGHLTGAECARQASGKQTSGYAEGEVSASRLTSMTKAASCQLKHVLGREGARAQDKDCDTSQQLVVARRGAARSMESPPIPARRFLASCIAILRYIRIAHPLPPFRSINSD